MTVGENIKRIRIEKGLTQKKLGDLCGINEANIRKYENGRQNPKFETIIKISKAMDTDFLELIDDNNMEFMFIKKDRELYDMQTYGKLKKRNFKESVEQLESSMKKNRNMTIESVGITIDNYAQNMLMTYLQLNDSGKKEAVKRVSELTEIKKYTEKEE